MIGFSILFEFFHGNEDSDLSEERHLLDLFNNLNEFLLMQEILHEFCGGVESSASKIRLFHRLSTCLHGCKLVWCEDTLASHPLHELGVVNFPLTFDYVIVIKTFLCSRQSKLCDIQILPDTLWVILTINLIKNLEHTLDKPIELIETESH